MLAAGAALAAADPARARLEELNVRETVLSAEQGRNLNRFARLLTVLERYRRDPPPALLVSPGDAVDAARAAILVRAITPELQRRARIYAAQVGEIARQRRLAAVAGEALFLAESDRADQPAGGGSTGLDLNTASEPAATLPARLAWPAAGRVTRKFGQTIDGGGKAEGLSLQLAPKALVRAPAAGIVQYVGPVKGWGIILILRLAGGCHLVLAGLGETSVGMGQAVTEGGVLGGMPGQPDPELYLEVRDRGATLDPGRWLDPPAG